MPVLVEVLAGRLLGVPLLIALDSDPVEHVQQQHRAAGAEEQRSRGETDVPRGRRDDDPAISSAAGMPYRIA